MKSNQAISQTAQDDENFNAQAEQGRQQEYPPETAMYHSWSSLSFLRAPSSEGIRNFVFLTGVILFVVIVAANFIQMNISVIAQGSLSSKITGPTKLSTATALIRLPARDLVRIRPDTEITYKVQAYPHLINEDFKGKIVKIPDSPIAAGEDNYLIHASFVGPDNVLLLDGMRIDARIPIAQMSIFKYLLSVLF